MTENQRLKILMKELKLNTQKALADALSIKQGSLSDILREKPGLGVSDSIKYKLENLYRINIKWLETGEGNIFIEENSTPSGENFLDKYTLSSPLVNYEEKKDTTTGYNIPKSNAITLGEIIHNEDESPYIDLHNGNFLMVVPKIPIRASAGYRENYQDDNYVNTQFTKHYFTVPGNHYRGKYFAFVIEGDSMENYTSEEMAKDSIPDGSTATGREIGRQHWKNKFHLKSFQDYIIVHRDAIFAKRITHHDTESGIITCSSLNPDKARHPDFDIELDECLQILNIVDVSKPR